MLFSYKKTLLSLIYQFSIGRFSYISFYVVNPPRVREKRADNGGAVRLVRITPACAGKTYTLILEKYHHQDHPRVCGKNTILCSSLSWITGSPPRVREKLPYDLGSIAAYQDHPRVCGKNKQTFYEPANYLGSPPRVREKRSKKQPI